MEARIMFFGDNGRVVQEPMTDKDLMGLDREATAEITAEVVNDLKRRASKTAGGFAPGGQLIVVIWVEGVGGRSVLNRRFPAESALANLPDPWKAAANDLAPIFHRAWAARADWVNEVMPA